MRGIFEGIKNSGEELVINFADFFYFDSDDKINRRFTFLANGADIIQ